MQSYDTTVRDLGSESCRCGATKQRGHLFCSSCYFALPDAYRSRLWRVGKTTKAAARLIYWRALCLLGLDQGKGKTDAAAA
jgi:hypothetical protein